MSNMPTVTRLVVMALAAHEHAYRSDKSASAWILLVLKAPAFNSLKSVSLTTLWGKSTDAPCSIAGTTEQ